MDFLSDRLKSAVDWMFEPTRYFMAFTALVAIHFWRVRKDGGISGPL